MADVFISYTEANRAWVRLFTETLRERGWSVWWDRQIEPGTEFVTVIERELDAAQCVIVVWSRESAQSTWVRGEADRGYRKGCLLPVRIDDVDLPLPHNQLQTLNLAGWIPGEPHEELDRCLAAVEAYAGRPGAPAVSVSDADPLTSSSWTPRSQSWWRTASIATVLLLTLVGVVTWRFRHRWSGASVGTAVERMHGAAESLPTAWFSAAPSPRPAHWMSAAGSRSVTEMTEAAGEALRAVRGLPEEPRVSALAFILMKQHQTAVKELEEAVADPKAHAACYSDLAAARYEAAKVTKQPSALVVALADADRAVQLTPDPGDAPTFNRTLIVEELGITEEAAEGWQAFVRASRDRSWEQAGRRRLDALEQQVRRDWNAARTLLEEAIGRGDGPAIADLVRIYHHEARTYGEIDVLGEWGAAQADPRAAGRHLQIARAIGDALRQVTGESMLADAVTAIDRAGTEAKAALATGHAAYRTAIRSSDSGELRRAYDALKGYTPMDRQVEAAMAGEQFRKGDVAAAFAILSRLLERERAGAPSHRALAAHLQIALARCHATRRRWDDAVHAAADARRILTMIGENRPAADADVLLAAVADYLGKPDEAWTHRIPALRTMSGARDRESVVRVLTASARMELLAGRSDAALSLLRIAGRLAFSSAERVAYAEVEALRSRILLHMGEPANARKALLKARTIGPWAGAELDVVEAVLIRSENPRRSVELASKALDVYRRTASIDLPWAYHERGRSYLSLGNDRAAMRDFDDGLRAIAETSIQVQQPQVRAAVLATRRDLFDEAIRLRVRLHRVDEAFRIVEEAHQRELVDQTDRLFEGQALRGVNPADASAVSSVLATDTALIAFYALPESLLMFVVDRSGVTMRSASVSRVRLRQLADAASRAVQANNQANPFPPELYDLLFAQLDLSSAKNVVIVPDDALQQVPFAALYDRRSRSYLIEKVTLSLVPTTGAFLHSAARERQLAATAPRKVFVVTDPAVPPSYQLAPLPWAAAEGRKIAQLYDSAALLQRADATAEAFLTDAPTSDVIHFGGHALMDETRPENSRLLLAPGRSRNAVLAAADIARMNLSGVRLVTLAACSTMPRANAHPQRNGGIAGSFLTAGAANVVTASGNLEDRVAETFYTALHESFARGRSAAAAVREAQLAMLHSGDSRMSRPYAWAPFVVIGGSGSALRSDVSR